MSLCVHVLFKHAFFFFVAFLSTCEHSDFLVVTGKPIFIDGGGILVFFVTT